MSKLFDELRDLKKAYDKKLREDGETALKEAFKDVFDKHPRLRSVVWTQYTPYFNDGDACHFGVREFDVHVDGTEDEEDDSYYGWGESLYDLKKSKDEEVKALAEAVRKLEHELPEDVLESVFGDHCKVVATRDGFKVSEHDHD